MQRRAVVVDPLTAVNRNNLADYLLAAGRLEGAKAEMLRVLELNPAVAPETDFFFASILILQQQLDQALAAIRQWPEGRDRDTGLALVTTRSAGRPRPRRPWRG